jgi:hypothetical protein
MPPDFAAVVTVSMRTGMGRMGVTTGEYVIVRPAMVVVNVNVATFAVIAPSKRRRLAWKFDVDTLQL